jgi:dipicolinate synthase subunit B
VSSPVIGFALCGSFCTFDQVFESLAQLTSIYTVIPIMSENAAEIDSRFGSAAGFINKLEQICRRSVITTISEAEPIGPKALLDLLVIAPCTGNTLAKITNGITDTSVTMAYKAHLRNEKPVLIAISSNDALGTNAPNIGTLLNRRNNFFVPFYQDDPIKKPASVIADFNMIPDAIKAALRKEQIQPILLCPPA